ncbi:MAG: hypothetical protein JXR96_01275 [Deltaproteobacteria bacterium]|nr:hypothetical protein [Deltaproteobacteria bacterium]
MDVQPAVSAVSVEVGRTRQTPDDGFGAMVARGAGTAMRYVGLTARAAIDALPGGALVNAVADCVADAVSPGCADGLGGSSEKWQLLQAQERLQEEGMANSLRLLALQRRMHQESQTYTAVSNVMKARHELAKSAINNIR